MKEDVRLIAFTVSTSQNQKLNRDVTDMLREYAKRNSKLKVEQYDLNQEPLLVPRNTVSPKHPSCWFRVRRNVLLI